MASPADSARNLQTFVQAAMESQASKTRKKSRGRRNKKLQPVPVSPNIYPAPPIEIPAKTRCKRKSKLKISILQSQGARQCKFRVRGLVTVKEWKSDEEVEEIETELRAEFSRFGRLQNVAIVQEEDDRNGFILGDVVVTFHDEKDAAMAFGSYNGVLFGEKEVTCIWEMRSDVENQEKMTVMVCGMLTSEELQDPDEVADVEEEMMQIFCKHGKVKAMHISETTGDVTVTFVDEEVATKVVQLMNNSRYGGRLLTASLMLQNGESAETNVECVNGSRIVEMKRVAAPIVQPTKSLELQNLVGALLKRLAALQDRAHTHNPRHDKRSRRLVLGMHEVRRGLLGSKIVLLVMATDLDGCKAVEEKCAELVSIATEQEVPILAPMNRRKLGRSLQKSVRVSCIGVYSVEGANDLFLQILQQVAR